MSKIKVTKELKSRHIQITIDEFMKVSYERYGSHAHAAGCLSSLLEIILLESSNATINRTLGVMQASIARIEFEAQ